MKKAVKHESVFNKIRGQFITGLLATIPVGGTVYIFYLIYYVSEKFFGKLVKTYFGIYFIGIGLAGIILTILLIWIIGIITSSYVGKKLLHLQDLLFSKIPFLNTIFKTLKQLSHSIFDIQKKAFKYPVLVEIFNRGCYSIGFVTGEEPVKVGSGKDKMHHVFVPTAPNPTSGFLILVHQHKIKQLDIPVEEAFKSIVTAGIVNPGKYVLKK